MDKNQIIQQVKELLDADTASLNMEIPIALGKTEDGRICYKDLTRLHHLLIAGAAGQGKTSCLNGIITSMGRKKRHIRDELILISAKGYMELYCPRYAEVPKRNPWDIIYTLEKLNKEMELRYKFFKTENASSLEEYDNKFEDDLTFGRIVVIIDDYDHLIVSPIYKRYKLERLILGLVQMGNQVGIHLIISTRRLPSGVVLSNFPARIVFRMNSEYESRMIIHQKGAEKLDSVGKLIFNHKDDFLQLQGFYIDI